MHKLLAVLALLTCIPCSRNPLWGQSPSVGVQTSHEQKQQGQLTTAQPQGDHRGTKESPLVVDVLSHPKSPEEAAQAEAERHRKALVDGWTLAIAASIAIFNALLVIIGWRGVQAALATLKIVKRQVDLTEPRLHVDRVRAVLLEDGQRPLFFVRIMNSGIIAAENVAVSMEVHIRPGNTVRRPKDQVIAIPADAWRECFIRSGFGMSERLFSEYDSGSATLRISGRIKWNDKTVEYCYKYNPWPRGSGNRPKGVPLFVPCDFDTRVDTAIEITPSTLGMKAGLGSVKIEAPRPEHSQGEPRGPATQI